MSQNDAIVVDLGSCNIRAGFSGELIPTFNFPTVISPDDSHRYNMVGMNAILNGQELRYPIQDGRIQSGDDFRILMDHVFHSLLDVRSEDCPVFIADSVAHPFENRDMIAQILYNEFHVPALMIQNQPLCAILESGLSNGLVLDCGYSMTRVTPVFYDIARKSEMITYRLGGRHSTEFFQRRLSARNRANVPLYMAQRIKECSCYVSNNAQQEMANGEEPIRFSSEDGIKIEVGNEMFMGPEVLFNPAVMGFTVPGVPAIRAGVVEQYANSFSGSLVPVTIVGGTTLCEGFISRFTSEVAAMIGHRRFRLISLSHRDVAVWTGAAKIARSLTNEWITAEEYYSDGAQIFKDYHE